MRNYEEVIGQMKKEMELLVKFDKDNPLEKKAGTKLKALRWLLESFVFRVDESNHLDPFGESIGNLVSNVLQYCL